MANGFAQGLLNNPLFGLGIGLLQGGSPGGTLGGGMQAGLNNMMAMQRQQQAAQFNQLRQQKMQADLAEMERQKQQRDIAAAQAPQIFGTPSTLQPFEQDLFPGEQPIQGLMTGQEATGMYAQDPQMAGLMQTAYEADPMGVGQMLIQSQLDAASQKAPNAMREIEGLVQMGYPREQAVAMVMGKNQPQINMPGQQLRSLPDQFKLDFAKEQGGRLATQAIEAPQSRRYARQGLNILQNIVGGTFGGTGAWTPYKAEVARWLGVADEDVANVQLFHNTAGDMVMARIQDTKGSVSEKEMSYFESISPGADKDPFTNFVLFKILERAAMRNEDMAANYSRYLATGGPDGGMGDPVQYNKWYMENVDRIPEFDLDQLRQEYNQQILGKPPAPSNPSVRNELREQGLVK